MREFEKDTWSNALRRAEEDLMRATATIVGGRDRGESAEDYCFRVRCVQEEALERIHYAKNRLAELAR